MLRKSLVFVAFLFVLQAEAEVNQKDSVTWQSVNSFNVQTDRQDIQNELDKDFGCEGVPLKPALSETLKSYQRLVIDACKEAVAAQISLNGNENIIAVKLPSTGSCGDFNFVFLGPVLSDSHRKILATSYNKNFCAEGLHILDAGSSDSKEIVVEDADGIDSKNNEIHSDLKFKWTGTDLDLIR
jgi:hypothetical protein